MEEFVMEPTNSLVTGSFDLAALGDRLKRERLERNLTLDELATRTGVSRSMISAVESGGKAPTIVVLHRIATGLGIGMSRLMGETAPDRIIVRRRHEHPAVTDPSGWERRNLAPALPGLDFEFMRTSIPGGVDAGVFPPHGVGSREHIAVESGDLTLVIDGERHELAAGDSISYAADCNHQFINEDDATCVYYLALVE